jgi:hypothetical protein
MTTSDYVLFWIAIGLLWILSAFLFPVSNLSLQDAEIAAVVNYEIVNLVLQFRVKFV